MPTEERTTKGTERCATHPSRLTVGTCDVCGRPLCVECAVPVRGRVLGPECLSEVLGDDIPATPVAASLATVALARRPHGGRVARRRRRSRRCSRGRGSAPARGSRERGRSRCAGRCSPPARGDRTRPLARVRSPASQVARTVAIVTGTIVAVGSLLAALNPPPFTKPALAPWISLAAGAVAADPRGRTRAPGLPPHMFDSPLGRRSNRAGHGALDAPRIMCARKGTGWRSRAGFDMAKMTMASKIVMVSGILLLVDSFLSWQKVCASDILGDSAVWATSAPRRTPGVGTAGSPAHHGDPADHPVDLGGHPARERPGEPLDRRDPVTGHGVPRIRRRGLRAAEVRPGGHERAGVGSVDRIDPARWRSGTARG